MKQEIKKQWIAALMGDEYKQGQRALRSVHEGEVTYCCLGVLCDIYSKETGTPWIPERDSEVFRMLNLSGTLPDAVQEWSGCALHIYYQIINR
jgi:hypothetical protein